MGSKKVIKSFQMISAASMAATVTSSIVNTEFLDNIGLYIKWASSDAVGVITVESSINYDAGLATGDWFSLTFNPPLAQPASNNGSYGINLNELPYPWLKVVYTRTSGSGTLNAYLSAKEV